MAVVAVEEAGEPLLLCVRTYAQVVYGQAGLAYCAFGAGSVSRFSTVKRVWVLSKIFLYAASVSCIVRSYLAYVVMMQTAHAWLTDGV
jgi:hypothetical protein